MIKLVLKFLLLLYFAFPLSAREFIVKLRSNEIFRTVIIRNNQNYEVEKIPFITELKRHFKKKFDSLLEDPTNNLIDELSKYYVIRFADSISESEINKLLNLLDVEYIEPNFKIKIEQTGNSKNDYISKQWHLSATNVFKAWKRATGKGIRIGIIDTGIDFTNNDLKSQIWLNKNEDINGSGQFEPWDSKIVVNGLTGDLNGIDDDGNGFIDDLIGYDFVDESYGNFGDFILCDPIPEDENGHGTMVASVIASANNDSGIVGVAPDAQIVVLRAFDISGNAEISNIASAIVYSALNRIEVLNFSFGTTIYSYLLHDAVKFAKSQGCIMVASAGNNGRIEDHYPSNFPEVISVGATTPENQIGSTSNFGPFVDIYAPGYQIFTSSLGGNFRYVNGTSFSAPIVSGICALLLEVNSKLTSDEIRSILQATQFKISGKGESYNAGIVDCAEAVNFAGTSLIDLKLLIPTQEFSITQDSLPLLLSVYSPFLESFSLILLQQNSVLIKNIFSNVTEQVLNDSINLALKDFATGEYMLKLVVKLRNGNTIERNLKFLLFNDNLKLVSTLSNLIDATFENKIYKIYISQTNLPTYCQITLIHQGKVISQFSDSYYSQNHFVLLPIETNLTSKNLQCVIIHKTKWGKSITDTLSYDFKDYHSNLKELKKIFNPLPTSYVFPKVIKAENDKFILLNSYNNLSWDKLYAYKFSKEKFVLVDSIIDSWIPVDTGDIDNDGKTELLLTRFGKTSIVKLHSEPYRFFSKTIYMSSPEETQWASQIVDIDSDNSLEIITYNESKICVNKFSKNRLFELYSLTIPDFFGLIGTKPNILFSDLDGNGQLEMVFISTKGFILNYEFNKDKKIFLQKWLVQLNGDQSSIYISVNSQKTKKSIMLLQIINISEKMDQIGAYWKLSEIFSIGTDSVTIKDLHYFYGVRSGAIPQGYFYRNGLLSLDLSSDGIDEVLVSAFPNFYIFSGSNYDSLQLLSYYPFVYSNSAVVGDFDEDSKSEIGFSTWDFFSFFGLQDDKVLGKPQFVDGWVDTNEILHLKWQDVSNANSYEILMLNFEDSSLFLVRKANFSEYSERIHSFGGLDTLIFYIRAIDENGFFQSSELSEPVKIFLSKRTYPERIKVLSPNQISVDFVGKLPETQSLYTYLNIYDFNGNFPQVSSVQKVSDTLLLISFVKNLPISKYFVRINSFRDFFGNYTLPMEFTFEITPTLVNDSLLIVKRVVFLEPLEILLEFSDDLDPYSAQLESNYRITPFGNLSLIEFVPQSGKQVLIRIDEQPNILSLGKDFYLQLGKIYSKDSTKWISPPFNQIAITNEIQQINNAFVYPNPINLNASSVLTFANIPRNAKIEFFDSRFTKLMEFENFSWKGGLSLDLSSFGVLDFHSGIYYFRITKNVGNGTLISSSLKKFSVVR